MNMLRTWTTIGRLTSRRFISSSLLVRSLPLLPSKVASCARPSLPRQGHSVSFFSNQTNETEQQPQALNIQVVSNKKSKSKAVRVCYGCGADIVPKNHEASNAVSETSSTSNKKKDASFQVATSSKKKKNFWETKKELTRVSKIKNWSLCARCKALANNTNAENMGPSTELAREAFRNQVRRIKAQHAVVVVVVDAINVAGTILKKLRDYVGGNPILLAVTRCDLLPDYYGISDTEYEDGDEQQHDTVQRAIMKRDFAERAKEWNVAEVFMISLPPNRKHDDQTPSGVAQLAAALLEKRMDRDVYVVGTANIGKSTLTDALVDELIAQQSLGAFLADPMSAKRVDAIREMRVTQSALPGTTLQNIRVPCFINHEQALWDTPGLLVDVSKHHFPIVGLEAMQRSAPSPIQPIELQSRERKFEVHLYDGNDNRENRLPLLRMIVRLKKDKQDDNSKASSPTTRLVWNSVFGLEAIVFDEANPPPPLPSSKATTAAHGSRSEPDEDSNIDHQGKPRSAQDKKALKEERRRAHQARIKAEQEELGRAEWNRRQREKQAQWKEERKRHLLSNLEMVQREKIPAKEGTDIAIENLGWFSLLCDSRDVLVEVFAPSTGVLVSTSPSVSLPQGWDWQGNTVGDDELEDDHEEEVDWNDADETSWNEENHEWDDDYAIHMNEGYYNDWADDSGWNDIQHDWDDEESDDEEAAERSNSSTKGFADDPWANYSGPSIGWEFLDDTRWSRGELGEGWHRIREDESGSTGDPHSNESSEPKWNEPLQQQYRIVYPESWRRDRNDHRRGRGNRENEKRKTRWLSKQGGKAHKSSKKGLSKKQRKKKGDASSPW